MTWKNLAAAIVLIAFESAVLFATGLGMERTATLRRIAPRRPVPQ